MLIQRRQTHDNREQICVFMGSESILSKILGNGCIVLNNNADLAFMIGLLSGYLKKSLSLQNISFAEFRDIVSLRNELLNQEFFEPVRDDENSIKMRI